MLFRSITLVAQSEQRGLGHAVSLVRKWVGTESFLLILGDHLFVSSEKRRCTRQLLERYHEVEANLIGIQATPESDIGRFGTVGGEFMPSGSAGRQDLVTITEFKEKPDVEYAREHLVVDGLPTATYLTVFGLYILSPGVLDELERRSAEQGRKGEVQLTDALEDLRTSEAFLGMVIEGSKIDIGIPRGYLEGMLLYAEARGPDGSPRSLPPGSPPAT